MTSTTNINLGTDAFEVMRLRALLDMTDTQWERQEEAARVLLRRAIDRIETAEHRAEFQRERAEYWKREALAARAQVERAGGYLAAADPEAFGQEAQR